MQLNLEQAADRLGQSVRQVRYLIQSGVLPAAKTGGRRLIAAAAFSFPRASSAGVKSSLTSSPARPGSAAPQCGAISRITAAVRLEQRPRRTGVRRSQ